jgi:hypothetical protein
MNATAVTAAMVGAGIENFADGNALGSSSRSALVTLITLVVVVGLLLLFGQFLWNNALVPLVPGVRPAKSIFQILGLSILISLLVPSCCQTI